VVEEEDAEDAGGDDGRLTKRKEEAGDNVVRCGHDGNGTCGEIGN
jgi:hypothetical protein